VIYHGASAADDATLIQRDADRLLVLLAVSRTKNYSPALALRRLHIVKTDRKFVRTRKGLRKEMWNDGGSSCICE
jgi:hypothetical protein